MLNQFSNYRTEWRNPSTHDYKLYFDESEAFLAIISVSAFACLLLDQIAAKIAFDSSKAATEAQLQVSSEKAKNDTLYHQASALIQKFASTTKVKLVTGPMTEAVLLGSLHGAFASALPDVEVVLESLLSPKSKYRADLILKKGNDRLIVELKRYSKHRGLVAGREQVEKYLEVSGINQALLVFMPDMPEEVEMLEYNSDRFSAKIGILLPKSAIKKE